MDKIVGNALLNPTRQPVLCFTERVQGTERARTEQDVVLNKD